METYKPCSVKTGASCNCEKYRPRVSLRSPRRLTWAETFRNWSIICMHKGPVYLKWVVTKRFNYGSIIMRCPAWHMVSRRYTKPVFTVYC